MRPAGAGRIALALYATAWLLFGAVYAAIFLAAGAPWGSALRTALATVVAYGLFGFVTLGMPGRLPWPEEAGRARFFAMHAGWPSSTPWRRRPGGWPS